MPATINKHLGLKFLLVGQSLYNMTWRIEALFAILAKWPIECDCRVMSAHEHFLVSTGFWPYIAQLTFMGGELEMIRLTNLHSYYNHGTIDWQELEIKADQQQELPKHCLDKDGTEFGAYTKKSNLVTTKRRRPKDHAGKRTTNRDGVLLFSCSCLKME